MSHPLGDENCCLIAPHKVGRMMMNIRGLVLDDPKHTTHLHTVQFAPGFDLGIEIEEVDEQELSIQTAVNHDAVH
jgi:hypothetical protein